MPTIAVVPGDGVGPEVIDEALRVLQRVGDTEGVPFETQTFPFSADHYLKTGELMPDSVYKEYQQMDAILLGAIGDPRVEVGVLERAIVGGIRWNLDLFVNLRPIRLYAEHLTPIKNKKPEDIDMIFVRENITKSSAGSKSSHEAPSSSPTVKVKVNGVSSPTTF